MQSAAVIATRKTPKLLDEVRQLMRRRHYSIHTERVYCDWIRRYVQFHRMQSRSDLEDGATRIEAFLTHLAIDLRVAPSTQNQALNALVFLYKHVLKVELAAPIEAVPAARKRKVPVVLTREEVREIFAYLTGTSALVVSLLYGSGLGISEAIRLRVHDIDVAMRQITVRQGKGNKDRITTFPDSQWTALERHLVRVQRLHTRDLEAGFGAVYLPNALARKYPNAARSWGWQYVFPSRSRSIDPRSGAERRHHIDPSTINRAIRGAVRSANIHKHVTAHTFRHSFATHLLARGTDIRTVQALLGHKDVKTTMIYTHVLQQGGHAVASPLDDLL